MDGDEPTGRIQPCPFEAPQSAWLQAMLVRTSTAMGESFEERMQVSEAKIAEVSAEVEAVKAQCATVAEVKAQVGQAKEELRAVKHR